MAQTAQDKGSKAARGYRDLPVVAIIGRPNVGKSTLFNRLMRGRVAIVDDEPGVTRDRNYRETAWKGKRFFVVDTGGLVLDSRDALETLIRKQVEAALAEATVVVLVVDADAGLTPLDAEIARVVRKQGKPYLLAVNKTDSRRGDAQASEFHRLGLGDFIPVSAEHGLNIGELLDRATDFLPSAAAEEAHVAAIAVVGKPNVGKSSLVNRLTGSEAVIVHDEPGTTRDATDTYIKTKHGLLRLVDTAGLRRKARADTDLEKYANVRTMAAIDRSDAVILMLDPDTGITKQDLAIASYVERAGKGIVLAWNKWDLRTAEEVKPFTVLVARRFRHMSYVRPAFISCLTGSGVETLLEGCMEANANRDARIPTGVLNRGVLPRLERTPAAGRGKHVPRVYYMSQTGGRPPAFTLFVNDPSLFSDNYKRYVERVLRELFAFEGTPLRIRVRKSK